MNQLNKMNKNSVDYFVELNYLTQRNIVKSVPEFLKLKLDSQKMRTNL